MSNPTFVCLEVAPPWPALDSWDDVFDDHFVGKSEKGRFLVHFTFCLPFLRYTMPTEPFVYLGKC